MKMWGGRFSKEPETSFMEFTSSISFDVRLFPYDILCTKAWVGALEEAGVLDAEERVSIEEGLDNIRDEFGSGDFELKPTDEDIHTAIERRLKELVGPAGGKVRTGRSRNDQVATDLRLLVMDECESIIDLVRALQSALIAKAEETIDVTVPGHTHLQQAQPVLLAHLLLAFFQMFQRDVKRLRDARREADCMPLGSGAMAGTGVPLDRSSMAQRLGFSRASENSADAVSDRDFVCEMIFTLSLMMVHLSRLSEQVILWCSQEFGLAELDDAWATGSSLMPQKKNPDGPELVRGKTGRVTGGLVAILTVLKGLPLAYNRDLQEDKEPLFDAIDTTSGCLRLMERTVATMSFNAQRASELAGEGFITATDLADCLVEQGVPFPEAHQAAGEVVARCLEDGKDLLDLTDDELLGYSDLFETGSAAKLSIDASLARRCAMGGTSPEEVSRQIEKALRTIEGEQTAL